MFPCPTLNVVIACLFILSVYLIPFLWQTCDVAPSNCHEVRAVYLANTLIWSHFLRPLWVATFQLFKSYSLDKHLVFCIGQSLYWALHPHEGGKGRFHLGEHDNRSFGKKCSPRRLTSCTVGSTGTISTTALFTISPCLCSFAVAFSLSCVF